MRRALAAVLTVALLGVLPVGSVAVAQSDEPYEVLVVGKTSGFRHGSIVPATTAIMALGEEYGFSVDVWDPQVTGVPGQNSAGQPDRTLPSTPFTSTQDLAKYATIIFVSTVDNTNNMNPARPTLLNPTELAAFQGYIRQGGGFAGIHAATDSMHTIPWYSQLTGGGARFRNHPANQTADNIVEDPTHPSTSFLPDPWTRFDEWYNFTTNPRPAVRVLLTLDESSYSGNGPGSGAMGDHPIAWCHNFEGGRSWYTAGGHTNDSFITDALFLEHLLQGIEWSAGKVDGGGDCVTFYEMDGHLDDLAEGDARAQIAARRISIQLDRAHESAEDGDRARAVSELRHAETLASSMIRDADMKQLVTSKIADLSEWQQALATSGR